MLSDSGKPMLTLCVPNFVFGWQQLINVTVLKPASCCTAVNPFLVAALSLTLLLVIRVCYCGVADSFLDRRTFSTCKSGCQPGDSCLSAEGKESLRIWCHSHVLRRRGAGVGRGGWIPLRSSTSRYISLKLRQACIN